MLPRLLEIFIALFIGILLRDLLVVWLKTYLMGGFIYHLFEHLPRVFFSHEVSLYQLHHLFFLLLVDSRRMIFVDNVSVLFHAMGFEFASLTE